MLAATANNAKIIDEAIADDIPVFPKRGIIYLVALVLGFVIPVAVIFLIDLTKFRVEVPCGCGETDECSDCG